MTSVAPLPKGCGLTSATIRIAPSFEQRKLPDADYNTIAAKRAFDCVADSGFWREQGDAIDGVISNGRGSPQGGVAVLGRYGKHLRGIREGKPPVPQLSLDFRPLRSVSALAAEESMASWSRSPSAQEVPPNNEACRSFVSAPPGFSGKKASVVKRPMTLPSHLGLTPVFKASEQNVADASESACQDCESWKKPSNRKAVQRSMLGVRQHFDFIKIFNEAEKAGDGDSDDGSVHGPPQEDGFATVADEVSKCGPKSTVLDGALRAKSLDCEDGVATLNRAAGGEARGQGRKPRLLRELRAERTQAWTSFVSHRTAPRAIREQSRDIRASSTSTDSAANVLASKMRLELDSQPQSHARKPSTLFSNVIRSPRKSLKDKEDLSNITARELTALRHGLEQFAATGAGTQGDEGQNNGRSNDVVTPSCGAPTPHLSGRRRMTAGDHAVMKRGPSLDKSCDGERVTSMPIKPKVRFIGDSVEQRRESIVVEQKGMSFLSHLSLHSVLADRLERINKLRTLHRPQPARLLGTSDRDVARFRDMFLRYDYNRSGSLDASEMHDALADLGLEPRNQLERNEVARVMKLEGGEVDFEKFCQAVVSFRRKLHDATRDQTLTVFKRYDATHIGFISVEVIMDAFADLSLSPEGEDERIGFLDAVLECQASNGGQISWEAFPVLVQTVRERIFECRRWRQVRLQKDIRMLPEGFLHFSGSIVAMHDAFSKMESSNNGCISHDDALVFIATFGFEKDVQSVREICDLDDFLREVFELHDAFHFVLLLAILHRLREMREKMQHIPRLWSIFVLYDVDQSGDVGFDEILRLCRDVGLPLGSTDARVLFDGADRNKSGELCFEEFCSIFEQVSTMLSNRRLAEAKDIARKAHLSEDVFWALYDMFGALDIAKCGSLSLPIVTTALEVVKYTEDLGTQKLVTYDQQGLGAINVETFIQVMKDFDACFDATKLRNDAAMIVRRRQISLGTF